MLTWMREKFGVWVIGGIIVFVGFVFVFADLGAPNRTSGVHAGAVAGVVNGDAISLSEFNRELNRRIELFKGFGGGQLTEAQIKTFRIREGVFSELVNRKLMTQEAVRQGLVASDEEVREKIREIPAFNKEGKFDSVAYKRVLEANNYTPSVFENLVREDLMLQQWGKYFKDRVKVSEDEIKREYLINQDKRNIRFALLNLETGRKGVKVGMEEIRKFLGDAAKANLAKSRYDANKDTQFKGKSFDSVKEEIARDIVAGEKTEEIRKLNETVSEQILVLWAKDPSSDAKVNAILKEYGTSVRSTGLLNRLARTLPGVGDAPELIADAFKDPSPIDPKSGGKPKKYSSASWWMVAWVSESQRPDLSKFENEKDQVRAQLALRKERELFDSWLKKLSERAKIEKNEALLAGG